MFDFEGDDDFDTLGLLRDYEGPGDFSGQVQPGRFDALLGGPGAGGYIDAPAASQESSQTDAARAERDRLAAAEAERVRAETAARWADEDAAAAEAAAAEAARNAQVRVGGTVVVDDRGAGGRLSGARAVSAEGGEVLSAEEAARRSVEATAAARRHDEDLRRAREEANSPLARVLDPLGLFRGAGGGIVGRALGGEGNGGLANILTGGLGGLLGGGAGGSPLPGALLNLFGLGGGGAQSNPISQVLASVLGATDAASQGLQTARATAAQVLGVTLPQLDELQRYVTEQRAQWDATAEHRALMSQEQFRNDLLTRMWSVEEQLRRLQGSLDLIGPARW